MRVSIDDLGIKLDAKYLDDKDIKSIIERVTNKWTWELNTLHNRNAMGEEIKNDINVYLAKKRNERINNILRRDKRIDSILNNE